MKQRLLLLLSLISGLLATAQTTPFHKGVNLTGWFQVGSAQEIQFTRYTREDFEQIQSLGCDVIRLPINLHFMTNGAPTYQVDPLFYFFMDQVVDWAEELQLHLILDNHTFDPASNTDPAVGTILKKVWKQVAAHYAHRSTYLYYEVLNEPHGIGDALWGTIQGEVIDEIRTVDTTHTLIVGPAGWNSYHNLALMPIYSDSKLIYTFHFYDPFLFTHQGASWTDPSMVPLSGVPFPYQPGSMPTFPTALNGTWIQSAFNDYANVGTLAAVQNLLNIAQQFRQAHNVPVFCGEFGVYIPNSDPAERVNWYREVRSYLDTLHISWTSWDYHGGFGIFHPGGNDLFEHDLNVPLLQALGFTVPPQSPFVITPDSVGRMLYDDYVGADIYQSNYSSGPLNFYAEEQPNYGTFTIRWDGPEQYQHIGFDFVPNRDLSQLVSDGYALDLFMRGNPVGASLDIRFLDTKTADPNDHPWRMRYTVSETDLQWDNRWYHLHLPLSGFEDQGSWDNNTWYNPIGAFDWTAIDRLEIVAEHQALPNGTLWVDQIQLTNQDTATVRDTSAYTTAIELGERDFEIVCYPNPTRDQLTVQTDSPRELQYRLYDLQGRTLRTATFRQETVVDLRSLPQGLYLLSIHQGAATLQLNRIWRQ